MDLDLVKRLFPRLFPPPPVEPLCPHCRRTPCAAMIRCDAVEKLKPLFHYIYFPDPALPSVGQNRYTLEQLRHTWVRRLNKIAWNRKNGTLDTFDKKRMADEEACLHEAINESFHLPLCVFEQTFREVSKTLKKGGEATWLALGQKL